MLILKILRLLKSELYLIKYWIICSYPDSYIGDRLRDKYWRKRLKKCGSNAQFKKMSGIGSPELVTIGNDFFLSNNCNITAIKSNGIYIGDYVGIGRGAYIHAANYKFDDLNTPIVLQDTTCKDVYFGSEKYSVIIRDNVLIGSNVVILFALVLKFPSFTSWS